MTVMVNKYKADCAKCGKPVFPGKGTASRGKYDRAWRVVHTSVYRAASPWSPGINVGCFSYDESGALIETESM